jgi:hypothetical protein
VAQGQPSPNLTAPALTFTQTDYLRLLAEKDVAPYFRARFLAIAYRTMPLRQLNAAAQQGRFDRAELVARWRDLCFTPADAETLADTTLAQAARQAASAGHGYTAAAIAALAEENLLTPFQAYLHLAPQGFTQVQVNELFEVAALRREAADQKKYGERAVAEYARMAVKAYGDGSVDNGTAQNALIQAGYSVNAATLTLQTVDLEQADRVFLSGVKRVQKAYESGEVDSASARSLLLSIGAQAPRAAEYVAQWTAHLTIPRKALATGKILKLSKEGLLSIANARVRLLNLGWTGGEADLQLAEVEQQIDYANALAATKKAKALAQAQKMAQAAIAAAQRQSCKYYTVGKLQKWYATRVIDEAEFRNRSQQCGRPPEAIERQWREAEVRRAANDAKAETKGTAGVEYSGPGADTGPVAT